MDETQREQIASGQGFFAALDQSGGSTPKALAEYGIPDDRYGQVVGAAVVLADPAVDEDALRRHCRERVAAFKVPVVVHVVDAIPRTPTGKVQRPRMAEHFGEA